MDGKRFLVIVFSIIFLLVGISAYYMIYRMYRKEFPVYKLVDDMGVLSISASLGEDEWKVMREEVFPQFERRHGCKIRAVNIEAGDTLKKIEVMHKAGKMGIDVLFLDNMNLAPYVEKRLVLNLNRYRNLMEEQVYDSLVKPLEFNGRLMFFPGRPNVQITYYNTDVFDGKKYKIPQTWDELLEVSKRLKEEYGTGKVAIHATLDANTTSHVFEFIEAAGGDITDLNDPGTIEAFRFLKKLYPYLSVETKKANWNTTNKFLSEESIYLGRNWPFGMNIIVKQNGKENIKAYDTWAGPEGKATTIGGDVIAITKRSKKHEMALEFAKYLMSKQVQTVFVEKLGWPPIRGDVLGKVPKWQRPFFKAVTNALKHGKYRPAIMGWSIVDKYVNNAFKDIVMEQGDVESILKDYAAKMNEELKWLK